MIKSFQILPGELSNYISLQLFIVIFQIFLDWYNNVYQILNVKGTTYSMVCYKTLKQNTTENLGSVSQNTNNQVYKKRCTSNQ